MAWRRVQRSLPDCTIRRVPNNVDQLTLKYMEMCKMESSTDSDSEVSPRWSDTGTLGCVTLRRSVSLTCKSVGRHASYSMFSDPYDGSSEDSDQSNYDVGVSSRQTRQQSKRRKRLTHHPVPLRDVVKNGIGDSLIDRQCTIYKDDSDVQMKCESDSELWDCEIDALPSPSEKHGCRIVPEKRICESSMHIQTMNAELHLHDSGLHSTGSSTPHTPGLQTSVEGLNSCSERSASPCNLRSFCKRKGGLPGVVVMELGPRKRKCIVNIEDEQEEKENF